MSELRGRRFGFVSHHDGNLYRFRLPVMRHLLELGCKVYAICPSGRVSDRFESLGIEHVPLEIDRLTFRPSRAWTTVRILRERVRSLDLDLVHSFTLRPNLYANLACLGLRRTVVVNSVTGMGSMYATRGGPRLRILRLLVGVATAVSTQARAAAVVFQNRDDLRYFVTHRMCRKRQTRLIPGSGVDLGDFDPARCSPSNRLELREAWGIPTEGVLVTMIARIISSKGVREYFEAAGRLRERASFVLIGEPDPGNPDSLSPSDVRRLAEASGVTLTGHQDNISEWLCASDIYALPSYREGLPRTVLEAMAAGRPIVVTDVPGCRETVIDERNGLLVAAQDARALADALASVIEAPEMRMRMGAASREIAVEQFDVRSVVERHVVLYRDLLHS